MSSGLLVLKPSIATYSWMLRVLQHTRSFSNLEQDFLNLYFGDSPAVRSLERHPYMCDGAWHDQLKTDASVAGCKVHFDSNNMLLFHA